MFTKQKSSQTVSDVLKTNDLFLFKSINGNRTVNPMHVKRLTESIKKNGMLCNPIIVNENYQVIDGQHRLEAAKLANESVYYIIVNNYNLSHVHTLNLNQKNWTKKDYMDGYAEMGIKSYQKLKDFYKINNDYAFTTCIAFCSNNAAAQARAHHGKENFEKGTWKGKDFNLAQEWADKIRLIKEYYSGYNRTSFVSTFITLLKRDNFDYNEFMQKIRLQPTALVDCSNADQYKALIEDIYNYRRREKVSLKY